MIAPCLAKPQTIKTGPYTISFDLGISNKSYLVNVSAPKTNESLAGDISTEYQKKSSLTYTRRDGRGLKYAREQLPQISDVQTDSQIICKANFTFLLNTRSVLFN